MSEQASIFTVSQLARGSGRSRQAIRAGLVNIEKAGCVEVDGRQADAWSFDAVPLDWQMEITRRGVTRGYDNGERFLAALPAPWRSPIFWDQVPDHQQKKAVKLQRAFAQVLKMRSEGAATAAEIERVGVGDFAREFGYVISARQFRRLLSRTIERDAGEENWQRLDLYLDERAFKRPKAKTTVSRAEWQHQGLGDKLTELELDKQNLTAEDREYLWDAVCRHYEDLSDGLPDTPTANHQRRLVKASLISWLFKAFPGGTLSATELSLRRRFDEKLAIWREKGRCPEAVRDMRPMKSGRFRQVEFKADLEAIRDRAILHDGNIALAHRLLREEGKLSHDFCEFYSFDVRNAKSEVPAAVRNAVAPMVKMCLPLRRGPWQARMRGPYTQRDWSEVRPGDWFCADDVTYNHYFREQLPDGRWRLLRGECLLMCDLRTGYPIEFLLIAGHYNGEHVRSLALKAHDRVGLPRKGFYFERGVWNSRMVVGERNQGTPVHWREAENGLASAEMSLEVRHATTPRAKPIEGLLRILQERMRSIPGFVGFNERTDEREREQALIVRANNQDPEALKRFPTQSEWAARIADVVERFSHDPQNGQTLDGKAPAEAWAEEIRRHPLRRLPDEARYILSTHRKEVTIRQEGIVLTIRGQRRIYFNEHTGGLIGRRVLAFYNLEMPDLLTVSDMERKNYFTVRAVKLPAMSATPEQLAEVNRLKNAHMAPARTIFGGIKHEVVSTITRDTDQKAEVKALGRFHNEETERAKAHDSERGRKMRKLHTKAAAAGLDLSANVRNPDDALQAIERRSHFLRALEAEESERGLESK